jgi:hypothetical protein
MAKALKILWVTALLVVVLLAAVVDQVHLPNGLERLNLGLYLRLVALIGLMIAFFIAWGYRRKVEASQRYRRSQQVLAEAEIAAQRRQGAMQQREAKLEKLYDEKERLLREELEKSKAGYIEQVKSLKEQNVKLKETINQLMQAVKEKKTGTK